METGRLFPCYKYQAFFKFHHVYQINCYSLYPENGECIICMERRTDTIISCMHSYCSVCIEQWKAYGKNFCPLCREPLQTDGLDSWVMPKEPENDLLREYLATLAVPTEEDVKE